MEIAISYGDIQFWEVHKLVERRREPRVIIKKEVVLNSAISAMGLDLSEQGIYIHTGRNFQLGSTVFISLPLDKGTVFISARVQHSKPGVGMGLMFLNMTLDQKKILCEFLRRQKNAPSGQARKKVLIIDGNAMTRKVYGSKIVLEGFTLLEAEDHEAAMGVISDGRVDLVLMDIYQPGSDGFETVSKIRSSPETETIPILVLSAKSSREDMEKAMKIGATEFMPRTFTSPAKLTERIKFYLN